MRERPILFSAPMVRAILDLQKTQTRRVVKPDGAVDVVPFIGADGKRTHEFGWCPHPSVISKHIRCTFGQPGDRLWVRETWGVHDRGFDTAGESLFFVYRADDARPAPTRWRPSIHMPRAACRLLLEITGVRVERLRSISDDDARAEGCEGGHGSIPGYGYNASPAEHFAHVWHELYGDGSWQANPWVWVIDFKRVEVAHG